MRVCVVENGDVSTERAVPPIIVSKPYTVVGYSPLFCCRMWCWRWLSHGAIALVGSLSTHIDTYQ